MESAGILCDGVLGSRKLYSLDCVCVCFRGSNRIYLGIWVRYSLILARTNWDNPIFKPCLPIYPTGGRAVLQSNTRYNSDSRSRSSKTRLMGGDPRTMLLTLSDSLWVSSNVLKLTPLQTSLHPLLVITLEQELARVLC